MTCTSRERVLCAIHFERPDRVPFNFHVHPRRMEELKARLGPDFRVRHFDADIVECGLHVPYPTGEIEWCGGWPWVRTAAFETWEEAEKLALPDPADPAIYEALDTALKNHPKRAVLAQMSNILGVAANMRPPEELYAEMLQHEEAAEALFHRLSDVMAAVADAACRRDITALYVMDDIGTESGLLMSPDQFRRMVLPHWKKVVAVAHGRGKPVFFHTDGKVDAVWDIFAEELGVGMLNAVEPHLQDIVDFKKRFQGRMGIYGGLDAMRIPSMSQKEVREHVFDLFEKAGADGGLIMSTLEMDPRVSDENIEALAGAIKECVY